jgi:hypothetical protein
MPKDPTIAVRDCLAEIAILHEIEAHTTLQAFRNDPIVRRAAAYAIQTISEAVRPFQTTGSKISRRSPGRKSRASATVSVTNTFVSTMPFCGDHHDRHPRPENGDGNNAGAACRRRPTVKSSHHIRTGEDGVEIAAGGHSVVLWRRVARHGR